VINAPDNKGATRAAGNKADKPPPAATSPAAAPLRPRDARQSRMAQAFSQVVAVLMRDPNYRKLPLAELEWLVLPPLMAGQFQLGQVPAPNKGAKDQPKDQQGGMLVPVAVALWARVSSQIDAALSANLDKQLRLPANQWVTGDHIWLMAVAGDPRTLPPFLERLSKDMFKDKTVKLRAVGADGKITVKTLSEVNKR
jgi:cytolysin-activating lysine-acyltransferase